MFPAVALGRREQGRNAEALSASELAGHGSPRRVLKPREIGRPSPLVALGELGRADLVLRGEDGSIESAVVD